MSEKDDLDVTTHEDTPAAVAEDIKRTRARLEETLSMLEQRLHPAELLERAKGGIDRLWQSGPLTPAREVITKHPFAVALIGVGVALWTFETVRQRRSSYSSKEASGASPTSPSGASQDTSPPDEPSYAGDFGLFSSATPAPQRSAPSSNGHTPRRGTAKAARWAKARAEGLARGARQRAAGAKAQAKGLSQRTTSRTQAWWRRVQSRWSDAQSALRAQFDAHPLAFAAGALASGAALGLLLRPTRPEDRLLGPRRDAVVQRVLEGSEVHEPARGTTAARHAAAPAPTS